MHRGRGSVSSHQRPDEVAPLAGSGDVDRQFDRLRAAAAHWNRPGKPPNTLALNSARRVVALADHPDLPPIRLGVVPTGGIRLRWSCDSRAATLDCLNDGLAVAIISDRSTRPVMWPVSTDADVRNALHRIAAFLDRRDPASRS